MILSGLFLSFFVIFTTKWTLSVKMKQINEFAMISKFLTFNKANPKLQFNSFQNLPFIFWRQIDVIRTFFSFFVIFTTKWTLGVKIKRINEYAMITKILTINKVNQKLQFNFFKNLPFIFWRQIYVISTIFVIFRHFHNKMNPRRQSKKNKRVFNYNQIFDNQYSKPKVTI